MNITERVNVRETRRDN